MSKNELDVALEESQSKNILQILTYFNKSFVAKANTVPVEILALGELALEEKFSPTSIDMLIRRSIHSLSKEAERTGISGISNQQICENICTRQNFHFLLQHKMYQYRIAWWLTPIMSNEDMLEAGFLKSYRKALSILDLPMTEKSASVILKTLEFFTNRHLGATIQKIEQKSLNMNVSRTVGEDGKSLDPEAMLERYEETKRQISARAEVIDVSDEAIEKG